jgi:hypothetical protein
LLAYVGLQENIHQMILMLTQVDGWLPTILVVQAAVINSAAVKVLLQLLFIDFTNAMLQVRSHIFTLDAGHLRQLKQKENFLCLKIKINL